ncbi:MAG: NifB/NifX family molybdenum-iron cluster-binding protein [Desulfocapsaceae bacterium]|nr:NifB/NifX family molybdenum-iron cluster-binding protein [Desulfocapsaceae bacterium]
MMDGASLANSTTSCPCSKPYPEDIIYLPVAPQLVARTRFSPPPDKKRCMPVEEAMEMLTAEMRKNEGKIAMAAIVGPGDPLATPELTLAMARAVKSRFPDLSLGLLTLGIGCSRLAGDLAEAGIDYVEVKVEGVRTEILEKLFAWIRPGAKTLKLADAASLLLKEQRDGVSALKFRKVTVGILTTLYPGYNIDHVAKISSEMVELGADSISLVPYCPEAGAEVNLESPSPETIKNAKTKASQYLPVVPPRLHHPHRTLPAEQTESIVPKPSNERPNVAVVSSNGIEIDLHLGHAIQFLIYGPRQDGLACLIETRAAPEPGSGPLRWQQTAEILKDCFVLLTASAGEKPRSQLAQAGLKILITEDNIEGMVDVLYGGGKKKGNK